MPVYSQFQLLGTSWSLSPSGYKGHLVRHPPPSGTKPNAALGIRSPCDRGQFHVRPVAYRLHHAVTLDDDRPVEYAFAGDVGVYAMTPKAVPGDGAPGETRFRETLVLGVAELPSRAEWKRLLAELKAGWPGARYVPVLGGAFFRGPEQPSGFALPALLTP